MNDDEYNNNKLKAKINNNNQINDNQGQNYNDIKPSGIKSKKIIK